MVPRGYGEREREREGKREGGRGGEEERESSMREKGVNVQATWANICKVAVVS